ncbi:UPF0179 family protein [Methanogenium cariaci]|uniref:UPF0179 family protein n=1 Tax=Methanogenium cariaci TaxID=2197 RepID=UPI00155DC131|nr:UPF0179 family protein [Methanogenium cariaci]
MTDKDEHTKITLIGKALAQEGIEFVYKGEVHACEGCRLKKVCHNLSPHQRYRIVGGVRTNTLHSCPVHMDGAYTVEVVEAAVPAAVPAERTILNSTVVHKGGDARTVTVSTLNSAIRKELYPARDTASPRSITERFSPANWGGRG